jgi:4-hydroxybenzoate polyprenyltransferase
MTSFAEKAKSILILLRPYQWFKNVLLFGGLVFSISLSHLHTFLTSIAAFVIFCMVSSSVYIMNDLRDRNEDRMHPVKRYRPLASGKIRPSMGIFIMTFLALLSFSGAILLNIRFASIVILYFIMNLFYSLGLKKVVILDVMLVAMGFLLRAIAGCVVIQVNISSWLFICTLLLALLLSFGKRRCELNLLNDQASKHRHSLEEYSVPFLDAMMIICGAATVVTYALYTMAPDTIERFHTHKLLFTTPFVLFGVFRYFFLIYQKNEGGDPVKLLVKDIPSLINGFLWFAVIAFLIYVPLFHFFA